MFSKITSGTIYGLQGFLVEVEVDFSQGLPCFVMVGSLSSEVKESSERVRTALKNCGMTLPPMHIAVNISPADIKKSGSGFDLPIMLGVLMAMDKVNPEAINNTLVLGELGLNGEIKRVTGVMPVVWEAKKNGIKRCIVPKENEAEARLVEGMEIIASDHLLDLTNYINLDDSKRKELQKHQSLTDKSSITNPDDDNKGLDFRDIVGQEGLKRGALIAVAGLHHLLIMGPPGTGKTMIAKRIPTIIPPMTTDETMDVTAIYSIAGLLNQDRPIITEHPFVNPHHTVSPLGMAGGGKIPKPGAVSLAHKGVLFLDELPEFNRQSIDMLRQPLESKNINITRASGSFSYPADFLLVGAMNPCPCGYYPDMNRCTCPPWTVKHYLSNISGPILDRIDICLMAQKIKIKDLQKGVSGLSSEDMSKRVFEARRIQKERYINEKITCNSELDISGIKKYCRLSGDTQRAIEKICDRMDISARAYHRILRVSRTIADLAGEENVREEHLMEAICYRPQLPGKD